MVILRLIIKSEPVANRKKMIDSPLREALQQSVTKNKDWEASITEYYDPFAAPIPSSQHIHFPIFLFFGAKHDVSQVMKVSVSVESPL